MGSSLALSLSLFKTNALFTSPVRKVLQQTSPITAKLFVFFYLTYTTLTCKHRRHFLLPVIKKPFHPSKCSQGNSTFFKANHPPVSLDKFNVQDHHDDLIRQVRWKLNRRPRVVMMYGLSLLLAV